MLEFPKRYADAVAKLRVPSGFLIVIVFAWLSHPTAGSLAWGVPVSAAGLLLRGWAAGCLYKDRQLATGGPYAHLRNPLYVGTLLVAAGLVIAARNVWLGALFAVVFLFVYLPVIQLEEQHLRRLFPEYASYAREVRALVPRMSRYRGKSGEPFRLSQYVENREYQAAMGYGAGLAFLLWKVMA
jgi:protein-S-isoprenylcysteine O-methyltransferase Ste14